MKSNYIVYKLYNPTMDRTRFSKFKCLSFPVHSGTKIKIYNAASTVAILDIVEYFLLKRMKNEIAFSTNLVQNKNICYN